LVSFFFQEPFKFFPHLSLLDVWHAWLCCVRRTLGFKHQANKIMMCLADLTHWLIWFAVETHVKETDVCESVHSQITFEWAGQFPLIMMLVLGAPTSLWNDY
jgi:hypothetical protein